MDVREKVRALPHRTGVYQFLDKHGKIIYIGKAKDLRNRVGSYFVKNHANRKTQLLVHNIRDVHTIMVPTEFEALLLENSLIKEHQPRYNIMLRDDKSFPFIRIRNERFPRVQGMRNPVKDGSEYYGPYASVMTMRTVIELVHKLYQPRTCNYDLSEKNISAGKYKKCLEYHIGNCKAPCEGLQSEEEYTENMKSVREIVKGRVSGVMKLLKTAMQHHADKLEFEEAEELKQKLQRLERYRARSIVVNPNIGDVDLFGMVRDSKSSYVNYMRVMDGSVVQGITVEMKNKMEESDEEVLQLAIVELRQRFHSDAPEAIVPTDPGVEIPGLKFTIPQKGDKKKLLEFSERNAKFFMMDKLKQERIVDPEGHSKRVMKQLQEDLRLKDLPVHIECFDNSNTQGSDPVSACVVFRNAKPAKKDYRHFNIRTVTGPDDFASMEEAVRRRYTRMQKEGESLPQLVVIDGGKGQLSSAVKALEEIGLHGTIPVIGIAKKLEEIYFPDDPLPLHLDKRGTSLKLIQHMRNEAHRFGITHHRNRRSKTSLRSQLEDVPGVGPATVKKLLQRFGSVKGVRDADPDILAAEVGEKRAKAIRKNLGI